MPWREGGKYCVMASRTGWPIDDALYCDLAHEAHSAAIIRHVQTNVS